MILKPSGIACDELNDPNESNFSIKLYYNTKTQAFKHIRHSVHEVYKR